MRNRIRCETVAQNGKAGESEAVRIYLRRIRQRRLHLRDCGIYQLQRLHHIDVPVEEEVDFRRATTGDGVYPLQSGNAVHRILHRACDRDHHLIDRHHAIVDTYDDAGKVHFREDSDRDSKCDVRSHDRQRDD